jgi:hypothetical protein
MIRDPQLQRQMKPEHLSRMHFSRHIAFSRELDTSRAGQDMFSNKNAAHNRLFFPDRVDGNRM